MKLNIRKVTIAAALSLIALGTAHAQTKLKLAHVYETSEPYHTAAVWAAGEIAKRTNGRYTVEVFPASTLGKETDINQGLTLGTVDIIYTGSSSPAAPMGRSRSAARRSCSATSTTGRRSRRARCSPSLPRAIAQKSGGNKVVAITYYGERHVTSNKPINKPEDMKGLKIRVPDAPLYTMFPRAVGANPTPIAFAEVYLALQNGTVDAQENPLPTIDAKKFYEVQKYIVLTGHITDALLTIVGGPTWNKLSDADKNDLRGGAEGSRGARDGADHRHRERPWRRVQEEGQGSRARSTASLPRRDDEAAQRAGRDVAEGCVRQAAGAQVIVAGAAARTAAATFYQRAVARARLCKRSKKISMRAARSLPKRSNSRPQPPRSCASSRAHRPTCSRCSTPSLPTRCGFAKQTGLSSCATRTDGCRWPRAPTVRLSSPSTSREASRSIVRRPSVARLWSASRYKCSTSWPTPECA